MDAPPPQGEDYREAQWGGWVRESEDQMGYRLREQTRSLINECILEVSHEMNGQSIDGWGLIMHRA